MGTMWPSYFVIGRFGDSKDGKFLRGLQVQVTQSPSCTATDRQGVWK